jgi:hypothetical protein
MTLETFAGQEVADELDNVVGERFGPQVTRPRSILPGCSASRVANCSATTSGEWLGSMTPPEPMRNVDVASARWAMSTAGAELAMAAMAWCSATQSRW